MIYVFLADGFEEVEAITPIDIMRRGGLTVQTVGVTGNTVTGAHGIEVSADIGIGEIKLDGDLEAVVLPGGMPGTLNLQNSKEVEKAVTFAFSNNRVAAAICAAPSVLGALGILKGKNAVCYPGFEDKLTGATVKNELCVKDGNIITACGAGAAAQFGFKLLETLESKEKAQQIKSGMIYER